MQILGFNITRQKALQPVADWRQGWRVVHESYAGAWQRNDELKRGDLTCYPALYGCLNRITQDIGNASEELDATASGDELRVLYTYSRPSARTRSTSRPSLATPM